MGVKTDNREIKEIISKYIVLTLCLIGVMGIYIGLEFVSKGNIAEMGLGTCIFSAIGAYTVGLKIRRLVFR